jgi:hypothetical protein
MIELLKEAWPLLQINYLDGKKKQNRRLDQVAEWRQACGCSSSKHLPEKLQYRPAEVIVMGSSAGITGLWLAFTTVAGQHLNSSDPVGSSRPIMAVALSQTQSTRWT